MERLSWAQLTQRIADPGALGRLLFLKQLYDQVGVATRESIRRQYFGDGRSLHLVLNPFPYHVKAAHYVLWSLDEIELSQARLICQQRFRGLPPNRLLIAEGVGRSIDIQHFHVFVKEYF